VLFGPGDERAFGAAFRIRRRQPQQRQIIMTFELVASLAVEAAFEAQAPFFIDEPRRGVAKLLMRIIMGFDANRFEEKRPARSETAQHIVNAGRRRNEFGVGGAL